MAGNRFQETYTADDTKISWYHLIGEDNDLKNLLERFRFTGAWLDRQAATQSMRAEFDDFGTFYTARIFSLQWDAAEDGVIGNPLIVWANSGVVVSYADEPISAVHDVRQKLSQNPHWVQSSDRLVYYLFDEILGELFPFLDKVNERIAVLEQEVFRRDRVQAVERRIFHMKREVLRTRRTLASMRDTVSQQVRYWTTKSTRDSFYYMELYDHMIRLFDTIDTYRELTNSVLDLYMSSVSNHLNEIVKTLTLVTTVLLPASLMAALYGMNFDYLPLAHYRWGFLVIIGVIGMISVSLYALFRHRRWL